MSLESPMIDRIKGLDIPVTSPLLAANYIRDKVNPKVGGIKRSFDTMIHIVTDQRVPTNTAKEAEVLFSYIVYEAVSDHVKKEFHSVDRTIESARQRTAKLMSTLGCNMTNSGFKVEVPTEPSTGTSTTKQRVPRGSGMSKKDRCLAMYQEKIELPEFKDNPKAMIQLFMDEFGLTKPGATTYEYNCRKGVWA